MKRAVMALALVTVVAGCQVPESSARRPGPVTTSAAVPLAVEWADKLCAVILSYDSAPKVQVDSSSHAAAVSSLSTALQGMMARIDDALGKLKDVGLSPVPGGDEAAQGLTQLLSDRRAVVDRSMATLGRTDPNDRTAVTAALKDIATDLQAVSQPVNPLEGMGARYPELQAAARSADNCTEISRVRASRSALPPTPSYPDEFPTTTTSPPSSSGLPSPPPDPTYPSY